MQRLVPLVLKTAKQNCETSCAEKSSHKSVFHAQNQQANLVPRVLHLTMRDPGNEVAAKMMPRRPRSFYARFRLLFPLKIMTEFHLS